MSPAGAAWSGERLSEPAALVAAGYDALGPRYAGWASAVTKDPRAEWLGVLVEGLATGARVLDLGCGPGVPTARSLSERFVVTGIDVSPGQLELARRAVPDAAFIRADMRDVELTAASFEAAVALFSLIHVPQNDLAALVRRIHDWLVPGGRFLAVLGTSDGEVVEPDWLGVPMFFSGSTPERNRTLVEQAGFAIVRDETITQVEPGQGDVAFHWLIGRRIRDP